MFWTKLIEYLTPCLKISCFAVMLIRELLFSPRGAALQGVQEQELSQATPGRTFSDLLHSGQSRRVLSGKMTTGNLILHQGEMAFTPKTSYHYKHTSCENTQPGKYFIKGFGKQGFRFTLSQAVSHGHNWPAQDTNCLKYFSIVKPN